MPRHRLLGSDFPTFRIAHTQSLFKVFKQALPRLKSSVLCALPLPRSISANPGRCVVMPRPLTVSRAGQGLVSLGLVFDRVPIETLQHKYMRLPVLPHERGRATAVRFFLKMARQHSHLCEMQMHQTLPWAPLLPGDHPRSLAGFEPSVTCALFALHLSAALANSWSPTTALAQDSLHALSPSGRAQSLLLVLGGDTVPGSCLKWPLSDCTITAALASFSR